MALCLTVFISLGVPSVLGATFTDVPQDNAYYEAIDILSDFNIILGDEGTGTFRRMLKSAEKNSALSVTRNFRRKQYSAGFICFAI